MLCLRLFDVRLCAQIASRHSDTRKSKRFLFFLHKDKVFSFKWCENWRCKRNSYIIRSDVISFACRYLNKSPYNLLETVIFFLILKCLQNSLIRFLKFCEIRWLKTVLQIWRFFLLKISRTNWKLGSLLLLTKKFLSINKTNIIKNC